MAAIDTLFEEWAEATGRRDDLKRHLDAAHEVRDRIAASWRRECVRVHEIEDQMRQPERERVS